VWGIVLAELARHVALAYQHKDGHDLEDVLERVLAGFHTELDSPTDQSTDGLAE
jgi:hypothetical protein